MVKKTTALIVVFIFLICTMGYADELTVMDEYDLLTPEEVSSGVLLDPSTLFAYRIQSDNTVMIVRYCWHHEYVQIPETIQGHVVSSLGDYVFLDTCVTDVFLPVTDIHLSDATFEYFDGTVWLKGNHPSLQFVIAIMNRESHKIEYYKNTESKDSMPAFRYWIEIDDYDYKQMPFENATIINGIIPGSFVGVESTQFD